MNDEYRTWGPGRGDVESAFREALSEHLVHDVTVQAVLRGVSARAS
jgi:hypothetical protein